MGIRQSAERAKGLVATLLTFGTRSDAEPTNVMPGELIASLEPMLRRSLGAEHHLQLEIESDA